MKKLKFLTGFSMMVVACLLPVQAQDANGLSAFYPFDGSPNDISGNARDGTAYNAVTYLPHLSGSAAHFNGNSQYISLPNTISNYQDLTVTFWVRTPLANPNTFPWGLFLASRDIADTAYDWNICLEQGRKVAFSTGTPAGDEYLLLTPNDIASNEWVHVACVADSANAIKKIFVNGQEAASHTWQPHPFANNDVPIFLGNATAGTELHPYFVGDLDELRIYNRPLSAGEILAAYNVCAPAPAGLVSWWPGEGSAADVAGPSSGVLHTVGVTGGMINQALSFNGASSYVEVPDSPGLRLTNELTIEFWVKRQRLDGSYGDYLIEKGGDWSYGGLNYAVALHVAPYNYALTFLFAGGWRAGGSVSDTNWHHCAVVARNGEVDPILYIDGTQQTITYRAGAGAINLAYSTQPLHLGAQLDFAYYSKTVLDEMSVYNRALLASEIQTIYNAGSAGKCRSSTAPVIVSQPQDQIVPVGASATFSVVASGTPPLLYQWFKGSAGITGATSSSFTIAAVALSDAGVYSVTVSNSLAGVQSTNASLTVTTRGTCVPPPGGLVSWWRAEGDATDDTGANSGVLVNGVGITEGIVGQAWVFNGVDGRVTVPSAPSLNFESNQNFSIEAWINPLPSGAGVTLIVDKRLAPNLSTCTGYALFLDNGQLGCRISASHIDNGANFVSPGPDLRDGNFHHVALSVERGSAAGGRLYVDGVVVLTFDPTSQIGDLSNDEPLLVGMDVHPYLSAFYDGRMDELSIYRTALSTADVLAIFNAGTAGKCSTPRAPSIVSQPSDQAAYLGLDATLGVVASGSPPLAYQWTFNGEPLGGATGSRLVLSAITYAQAGAYAVQVTNAYGAVTSDTAHVTVTLQPPYIITQPQGRTVLAGGNATFSVTASGSPPLSYQWNFQGTPIDGATDSSLPLANVTIAQSGPYAVVITNDSGSITSATATLTVNYPAAAMRVVSTSGQAGHAVVVPVRLTANGNENALAFSLSFNPALLTYAGASAGPGAPGAAFLINDSQAVAGRVGFTLGLSAGNTLLPGTQQVVLVSFMAAVRTTPTSTTIMFGDAPLPRQLADVNGHLLSATYSSGSVTLSAADFEADLAPRPNGNKLVDISDWVLAGRYAARLDYPTNASEFQRADCAPRASSGDGAITVTDWVQAGRYAARLDPLTLAGGPISEGGKGTFGVKDNSPRQVRVPDTLLLEGQTSIVSVLLEAQGNENALGFSVSFDPTLLAYESATVGGEVSGALFNVNGQQAVSGRLGFVLALASGSSFASGTREVVKIAFRAASANAGNCTMGLIDQPVPRQVSDPLAAALDTTYVTGTASVMAPPQLTIERADSTITLSWPAWGTNFVLQSAPAPASASALWTNVPVTATSTNNHQSVVLPAPVSEQYYRLRQSP